MTKLKNIIDKIMSIICTIVLISMVILVTFQVISRYVFASPSSVTEVLTRYMFVWLIITSATFIFGQREHICISFLKDKFKGETRRIIDIIIEAVIIFFSATVMIFGGCVITKMNMLQFDSILNIPTGIIYSVIPICGFLIVFYSIYNIMQCIKSDYKI